MAGVSGNGQKELGDLILGLRPLLEAGSCSAGADASRWSIGKIRESGVAFVPEDPLAMAAVPGNVGEGEPPPRHRSALREGRGSRLAADSSPT